MKNCFTIFAVLSTCAVHAGPPVLSISSSGHGEPPVILVTGEPGTSCIIESSEDLVTFTAVGSIVLVDGSAHWTVAEMVDTGFIRVVEDEAVKSDTFKIDALPDLLFVQIPAGSFTMGDQNAKGPIADT